MNGYLNSPSFLASMTDRELARAVAHARNARDAFRQGSEPQDVMEHLRRLQAEQDRRRSARRKEGK